MLTANNLRIWTGGYDFGGRFIQPDAATFSAAMNMARDFRVIEHTLHWVTQPPPHQTSAIMTQWMGKLRHAVGDRLWVREAWRCNGWATDVATIFYQASERDGYTAMCEQYPVCGKEPLRVTSSWRPSIHMPRWASRLTLIVTDLRVERLQDISPDDAKSEGLEWVAPTWGVGGIAESWKGDPRESFRGLWNHINGPEAWDANPWVAAYTFRVIKQNIDQIDGAV